MATRFSFDNAAFHFARTEGPGGFLWKYLLTYGLAVILILVLQFWLFRPVFEIIAMAFQAGLAGASEEELEAALTEMMIGSIGQIILGYFAMLILAVLFWAAFEAAVQRRYIREQGFGLRFGGDELRLVVVGLIWFAMFIAGYIASAVIAMVLIMPVAAMFQNSPEIIGIWGVIVAFAIFCVWLFLAIRFSAASALTIRDRKIRFIDAWGATKGRFWTMFGAFLLLGLILAVIGFVLYLIGVSAVVAGVASNIAAIEALGDDPEALLALLSSPAIIILLLATYVMMMMFQGFSGYAWAGIAALAAKTDLRGGGMVNAADEFG